MTTSNAQLVDALRASLKETERLKQQNRRLVEAGGEPIAVVGMSCRFPGGVNTPEQLWELVARGRDAMTPFPADRGWDVPGLYDPDPEHAGTSYVREGGFLHDAALFDPAFFGISPREALAMDPQQRLLLESSWEALERAGIDPGTLAGSRTGVFVGVIHNDYTSGLRVVPDDLEAFLGNGGAASVASGRVAYTLGLEGPAISVDTACSSSLVALHLAVQSLRRGECSMALAGGASVMATPGAFTEFSRQRGLGQDGRCKPFAAAADGTGWGEGVGVLLLERLSEALAKGHNVLAVIRGSAVNQDGASNGLSAPNGPAQRRVIRAALENAGLRPSDVDAVEAHGTGTTLGDPIEAQALLATYGQDRAGGEPLWLGSLKSNIGHAMAAAGVGGVIKMIMAMRHGTLPQSLHIDEPTPQVDWDSGAVELLTAARDWPAVDRPRRAGVSSFGISGTNAHLILEQAPPLVEAEREVGAPVVPWVVSAKSVGALDGQVERLIAAAEQAEPVDVARSLVSSRAVFGHRVVAVGSSAEELVAGLRAAVPVEAVAGRGPVFVFPGQGAQWVGMALALVEESPVFAAALAECAQALSAHVDWDLYAALADEQLLARVDVVQPVSFAVHVALARLWESVGVRPAAVVGHSQGEIAAAHVAGLLSLAEAARVVAVRSRVLTVLAGSGLMASVGLPESALSLPDGVSVAAVNAADSTVIAGTPDGVRQVVADAEAAGVRARLIAVDYASHSPMVESLREQLLSELGRVPSGSVTVPMLSTVTGEWVESFGDDYWFENLRRPVRFADAASVLVADGFGLFIEVSAHPVVSVPLADTGARVVGTLRRDEGGWRRFLISAGEAYAAGAEVDWDTVLPEDARVVDLPTYAFERDRFWLENTGGLGDLAEAGLGSTEHPLLPAAVLLPDGEGVVLTGRLSATSPAWLADHAVLGTVLLPGAAFVELAVRAGDEVGCDRIEELTLAAPLVLGDDPVMLRVVAGPADDDGRRPVTIHSCADGGTWTTHATGTLAIGAVGTAGDLTTWPPAGAEEVSTEDFYEGLAADGYRYGPAFRGLQRVWRRGDDVYAEVALADPEAARYGLHPALLDASLHAIGIGVSEDAVRLPFSWTGVTLHASGATSLRVHLAPAGDDTVRVTLADPAGAPVATVEAMTRRPITADRLAAAADDALFRVQWTPIEVSATGAAVVTVADLAELTGDVPDTVVLRLPDAGEGDPHRATVHALDLVRRWLGDDRFSGSRLAVVTTRAVVAAPGERLGSLAYAPVWGLIRAAQAENPDRFLLVDVDGSEAALAALPAALAAGEPEVALRGGIVHARRLTRVRSRDALVPPADGSWRLDATVRESLENLEFVPAPEAHAPLAPGEVRVGVRAAGINFRDLVSLLGMAATEEVMGGEAAGVVLEVGPGVTGLAPGDRVTGLFVGAFGPVAVTEQEFLARMPSGWSFADAAAVPIAFLTAYYGLVDLAGVRAGQRVLVHAGAGGVGMAAVQLAGWLGAEVFATASPAKWDVLSGLGLDDDHIASTRDLGFAEKFAAVTGGAGMDVVLDSLAREFVDASLGLLPRGGHFLEMGKTDLRDAAEVAGHHPGVRYRAYDLVEAGPARTAEMLAHLLSLFAAGDLAGLPVTAWDVRRAAEAFRFMSQARHVGKIVLTIPRAADPSGTVLITGGLGTVGGLVARRLADSGVRHLVLTGRRGLATAGAPELVAELERLGARVTVVAGDVSERSVVERVLAAVPADAPLTGVVHAAGVLDDGLVSSLTPERVSAVFAPKVDAAIHLDELTRDADLAFFTVFSSAAATLGESGQGNYAAANVFLESLIESRTVAGLPGSALAWGFWAERSSMTAHLSDVDVRRMARGGVLPLSSELGVELFEAGMASPWGVVAPVKLDLPALRSSGQIPAVLRSLVGAGARRSAVAAPGANASSGLAEQVRALPATDRERVLLDLVRSHVGFVLGFAEPDRIAANRAFKEIGFDSLTAVELRNRLGAATGLRLPATLVFDYPSPAVLARHLVTELTGDAPSGMPTTAVSVAADDAEPIAIVGMSCRFPGGADSPEQLWELVARGRDAMTPFPADRGWDVDALYDPDPDRPGTSYVREGGFLHDAARFDAGFFGISPREALAMDPQQRLLLESSWEALERAGIDPGTLAGSRTGVFVGVITNDYTTSVGVAPEDVQPFLGNGGFNSVASGRVAYTLGLEGPAISVDTACSSSLVALHLAAQSLRRGECSMALAGGASVMATPIAFTDFSRQRGMAADGRCKSFAGAADGTGWGEGVGMLVLERLSDAERLGHDVLAVVRGSAVNQDGASNGLTAPNGPSQMRVIQQALADAGLGTSDVDVVEAHGTGTTLGDPIEAQALLATYGQERGGEPLYLGSLKSNIGHTQAAAGVGGVIKMVMAMRHGVLPQTLHVDEPTPQVDWDSGAVELLTAARDWPVVGRPRRAGVSSFGISGTNAHVILEQASPVVEAEREVGAPVVPWVVSAKSAGALTGQVERLAMVAGRAEPVDVARSLVSSRAVFGHRVVAVGSSAEELVAGLRAAVPVEVVTGRGPVFVFPGQGAQWVGMALGLIEESPVFAAALAECAQALSPHVDWDLYTALRSPELLARVDVVQPVSFAVHVALARLWESVGVRPAAVVGHSQGEIAAAHVAGLLSLAEAARVVAVRSRVLTVLAGTGLMASVGLPESALSLPDGVSVAAVNAADSTVIAGTPDGVRQVVADAEAAGARARLIAVDYASHSPMVESLREQLLQELGRVPSGSATVPMLSTVTGEWVESFGDDYWFENLRRPVRFADAASVLVADGFGLFIEVSAHPVVSVPLADTGARVVGTLRRDEGGWRRFLTSAGEAYAAGADVDWDTVLPEDARVVDLPTYAFEHQRYWLEGTSSTADVTAAGLGQAEHPLLGAVVPVAGSDQVVLLTGRLSRKSHPWLADHAVLGTALLPGTAFVELAVRAGDEVGCGRLDELTLLAPLVIPAEGAVRVQVTVGSPDGDGRREVAVHSRAGDDAEWVTHASGLLAAESGPAGFDLVAWPPAGAEPIDLGGGYDDLAERGYEYGPAFRGLRAAWRRGTEIYAEVALPPDVKAAGFVLHPGLFDAALHALGSTGTTVQLPFSWSGVTVHASGATTLRVRLTPSPDGRVALVAADAGGAPVVSVDALTLRPITEAQLRAASATALHTVGWTPVSESPAAEPGPWAVLGADDLGLSAAPGYDDLDALLAAIEAGAEAPDVVFAPVTGADGELSTAVRDTVGEVLVLVQRWLADDRLAASRLVPVTTGAVAGGPDLPAAAVWGLVRSAEAENPDRFGLLDRDGGAIPWTAVAGALNSETELAVRDGELLVPRLARSAVTDRPAGLDQGTVLLTGGTGTIGAQIARHLVSTHDVRRLVITSRRGPAAQGAAELRAELAELGAETEIVACAADDRAAMAELFAAHPIRAVVHAAGVTDDGVVGSLDPARLDTVLRPKVDAAVVLHELTRDRDLAAFVLFSSGAGTFGSAGQANYAAANAFLDALAGHRRSLGLPGTSVAWGFWAERSELTGKLGDADVARMGRSGIAAMDTGTGLALFDAALATADPAVVAARFDLTRLRSRASGNGVPPALRSLVARGSGRRATAAGGGSASEAEALRKRIASLAPDQAAAAVLDLVRMHVASVLGFAGPHAVDAGRGLIDLGFDSLTALELRNRLGHAIGAKLPATLVFDYPTATAVAGHLLDRLPAGGPKPPAVPALAELDRLETLLAEPMTDEDRGGVRGRLQALLQRLGDTDDAGLTGKLDDASDEEMFAFIDSLA